MSKDFWLVLGGALMGLTWVADWMAREVERCSQPQDVGPDVPEPPPPSTPPPPPPARDDVPRGFYRDRFGGLTPLGVKRDRYGDCYVKNPNGLGWRELGSDPDEPYWVRRLD